MQTNQELLQRSPEAAARLLSLTLLDEAASASRRLDDEGDEEALHDFRVALRRLRSQLKAYRPVLEKSISKKQRGRLRELAAATGGARDAEVQLDWLRKQADRVKIADRDGWSWLIDRLEVRRREAYGMIRTEILPRFAELEPKLRRGLSRYVAHLGPAEQGRTFATTAGELARAAGGALAAALQAVQSAADVEGAHAARICAKRLRYLLEPLRKTELSEDVAALVKTMKSFQETLGELHDAHVLAVEIAQALVDNASERARRLHDALYATEAGAGKATLEKDPRTGLMAVDRLVRDRVDALFAELHKELLGEHFVDFQRRLAALAEALVAYGHRHLEIERKYLLQSLPSLSSEVKVSEITQGWIPGQEIHERLRRVRGKEGERFYRTIKQGSGIQRLELEEEAAPEVFERLWPLTEGHRVHKRRYKVPEGDRVWELDEFLDRDLFLAEIELASPDEAVAIPTWLQPHVVREVTGDDQYVNQNLAR
jgi:CHAD domain-containing protein/CYTH domain-containing protein